MIEGKTASEEKEKEKDSEMKVSNRQEGSSKTSSQAI